MRHHLRAGLARAREIFRRRSRYAAEQSEEFSFHIDMETAENIRRGMNEADARRAALLRFGGTQRFGEATADARGVIALDNLVRDARFALRRLHRAPGFAAGVIATLGIGIGVAVGIGTIVYGVLLRDLPYENPDRLVRVGFVTDGLSSTGDLHSPATYFHFAKSARSFTALGMYTTTDGFALTDGDAPESVTIASLAPSTLTLLGVRPLLGQLFVTGDTSWSKGRSAILISENLWRRRYGADSSIIGRWIEIDHGTKNVVGVLPSSFEFPTPKIDLVYPAPVPVNISARYLNVIGRLREGVTASAAEAELNALIPGLSERFPAISPEILRASHARVSVQSLKAATVAPVRSQIVLLGVLVAVVLLIATTNVVNLFLLRAERASQEIAIALSLGASRLALAQRFVIEGMVLGAVSSVVAVPVAALALSTKFGFTEREIPRLQEVSFTWQTGALVVACAMLIGGTVALIGLTRAGLAGLFDRLRSTRSTSSPGWRRAQNGLVALQVAIALVLLVAAGLLGRSFWNLSTAKIGFAPKEAMTFQVSLPWGEASYPMFGYPTYDMIAAFHAKVMDRLATLPGVNSVGAAWRLPLASPGLARLDLHVQSDDERERPVVEAAANVASADYFHTMQIPMRAGRTFRSGDLRGTPSVVVSERLAASVFGTTDVVGRRIRGVWGSGPAREFTIIGVVGDVQWARIEDGYVPMAYFPLLRDGDGLPADSRPIWREHEMRFVIRGEQLPAVATIQKILTELDHRVPAANVRTLDSIVGAATARVRLTLLLIASAGTAALLLGVIGVYSVVSYAAAGRVREFGIRLALGAEPSRVGGIVLGDGLRIVGIGIAFGLVVALGATRFLRALLYEVKPTSIAEFVLSTGLLVVVTVIATLLPARRASRTQPALVLRGE
jgi:predicted permease